MDRYTLPTGPISLSLYVSLISTETVSSAVEGSARIGFFSVFSLDMVAFERTFNFLEKGFCRKNVVRRNMKEKKTRGEITIYFRGNYLSI